MAPAKNKKAWFWDVKEAVLKRKTGILALQKCLFCVTAKKIQFFLSKHTF